MLFFVSGTTSKPLCVARDDFLVLVHLACDDVVMRSYLKRLQKPFPEVPYKVVGIFLPPRMHHIANQWVIGASCNSLVSDYVPQS